MDRKDLEVSDTNWEASLSKLSAINKGYIDDPFCQYLVDKKPIKKDIMIHRGYWSRMQAIRQTIIQFINVDLEQPVQIISLGAGLDSFYWVLQDHDSYSQSKYKYVEFDMQKVIEQKIQTINSKQQLKQYLINPNICESSISSDKYELLGCDLKDSQQFENQLNRIQLNDDYPTIVFSECVLAYVEPKFTEQLMKVVLNKFKNVVFVDYEMFNPNDPFGKMMIHNFQTRGCPLLGVMDYSHLDQYEDRFKQMGFENVKAKTMLQIYNQYLDQQERRRIEKIEFMDEFEEWNIIQSHYFILIGDRIQQTDKHKYRNVKLQ